ncbi:MAG: ABC transporter permease [Nitrososphaerota archaeon]|nr:ABC transporter permease [Nitrososphaerota archaeon]
MALLRSRAVVAGLIILALYVLVALVAAPILFPRNLTNMEIDYPMLVSCAPPSPPTLSLSPLSLGSHPLGETGFMGYGVAQGLIVGTRWDLALVTAILVPSVVLGTFIGLSAAAYGGKIDWFVAAVIDTTLSIPDFVFIFLIVAIAVPFVPQSLAVSIFVISMILVMWAPYARGVRSEALRQSALPYVEAAYAAGASKSRVAIRHLLPNSVNPILAQLPITVAMILALVIGIQYVTAVSNQQQSPSPCGYASNNPITAPVVPHFNYPEWGAVFGAGLTGWAPTLNSPLGEGWWGFVFPAIWISIFGLGLLFLSDGIRDVLSRNRS